MVFAVAKTSGHGRPHQLVSRAALVALQERGHGHNVGQRQRQRRQEDQRGHVPHGDGEFRLSIWEWKGPFPLRKFPWLFKNHSHLRFMCAFFYHPLFFYAV